jgi:Tfp pilus assembly protein PilV
VIPTTQPAYSNLAEVLLSLLFLLVAILLAYIFIRSAVYRGTKQALQEDRMGRASRGKLPTPTDFNIR